MTAGGLLIRIQLNSTFTTILSAAPVNNLANPIPGCEGLITFPFSESYNSLVGFSSNRAYKICPIDGSYQLLCGAVLPNSIPGATSIRLPNQNPEPVNCLMLATTDYSDRSLKPLLLPNPFSSHATLYRQLNLQKATLKFIIPGAYLQKK